MDPRISVDNICFIGEPLASDMENWRSLGARRIGVMAPKLAAEGWDESVALLQEGDFIVATLVHPFLPQGGVEAKENWQSARDSLSRTLDAAHRLGAETVYMTSGSRGRLSWKECADGFCEAIAPCAEEARRAGIPLLIEPASTNYADLNLTHTLRDTLLLAEQADIGVCIDLFACWTEADIEETIRRAMPRCHLVQVGDYVLGDRGTPCRAVPGDGHIPLQRLINFIISEGYKGAFDLELLGPRIDAEGRVTAVARAAANVAAMLPPES